jgi:hypothetical protein
MYATTGDTATIDIDLTDLIDIHVHSSPDVSPRLLNDIQVAQAAKDAGLRAVLLKSHVTLTADRAAIAEKAVPGIRVLGGLALNDPVGGLNPAAVEVAIRMGARQIWMPTISAANDIAYHAACRPGVADGRRGITIWQEDGRLVPAVHEILDLVAQSGIIVSTGHLSPAEIKVFVSAAREHGIRRVIVVHPEAALSHVSLALQRDLAQPGVWFEHTFASTLELEPAPLAEIAARIRAIGPAHVVLSTDLGIATFSLPVDGMRAYLAGLMELGFTWDELLLMVRDNPATLLGL